MSDNLGLISGFQMVEGENYFPTLPSDLSMCSMVCSQLTCMWRRRAIWQLQEFESSSCLLGLNSYPRTGQTREQVSPTGVAGDLDESGKLPPCKNSAGLCMLVIPLLGTRIQEDPWTHWSDQSSQLESPRFSERPYLKNRMETH